MPLSDIAYARLKSDGSYRAHCRLTKNAVCHTGLHLGKCGYMFVTYALLDPRTTSVFYVGLSNDLTTRFIAHITNREVNRAKNAVIDELRSVGMLPYCRTLEVTDSERAGRESERKWIDAFIAAGETLCNIESTGRQR